MYVNQAFRDYYAKFERARMRGVARNPALPADLLLRAFGFREMKYPVLNRESWTDEVLEAVAAHPDRAVRRDVAGAEGLTAQQRAGLLDDPDVRLAVADGPEFPWGWDRLARWGVGRPWLTPEGYERLASDERRDVREVLARARHTPPEIKARLAEYQKPPCATPPPDPAELAHSGKPMDRYDAATDPTLPAELIPVLAVDPSAEVRLAVSMRRGLSEAQRAAIDYHVAPADRIRPVGWAYKTDDPAEIEACVRSAHLGLRRSVAYHPNLTAEQVAVLASDDDFAVRLLLCENQGSAPGETVLETYLEARVIRRGELREHPAFPWAGMAARADDEDWRVRALVSGDPEASPELIDRLSRDEHHGVRMWMAGDERLSVNRVLELFEDPEVTGAAAANPHLPRDVLEHVIEAYAALDDSPQGAAVWLGAPPSQD